MAINSSALEQLRATASSGDVAAQFELGQIYARGEGVSQDNAEAVKWYQMAAERGCDVAQFCLGLMYRDGEGVTQDVIEADYWFYKACGESQEELARKEMLDKIHLYNDEEAIEWRRWLQSSAEEAQEKSRMLQQNVNRKHKGDVDK